MGKFEFWFGVAYGVVGGFIAFWVAAYSAADLRNEVCDRSGYASEYCQCRVVLGLAEKKEGL